MHKKKHLNMLYLYLTSVQTGIECGKFYTNTGLSMHPCNEGDYNSDEQQATRMDPFIMINIIN